jgi:hypothetical protein
MAPTKKTQPEPKSTYFGKHADKPAPAFVSPKGKASGGRKNIKGPGPRPDGSQPPSAQSDYLLQAEQSQEQKRH